MFNLFDNINRNVDESCAKKYIDYYCDWLYINAIKDIDGLYEKVSEFKFITDIEFNPQKSLSCRARTLTLYIWFVRNSKLDDFLNKPIKYYRNLM